MTRELISAIAIVTTSLVSEDGATIAAGSLVASGELMLGMAFTSAVLGIWVGDLGLYALGRFAGRKLIDHRWAQRFVSRTGIARAEHWFAHRGTATLVLTRFVPGTRLASYVTAGIARMSVRRFAAVTVTCAVVWVAAIFWIVRRGMRLAGTRQAITVGAIALLASVAFRKLNFRWIALKFRKYSRWEFWPGWLFYPPVVVICAWLSLRYRGIGLPTIANPGQRNGGIVGESKIEILNALMAAVPEYVADAYLIPPGITADRETRINEIIDERNLSFPFVLKPDTAQRGDGFAVITDWSEVRSYFSRVTAPVIVQRYIAGPREAGIFYYRFPGEESGHIFAITEKIFPHVIGNGQSTLAELIQRDHRASLIADTYLRRLRQRVGEIISKGEKVRLVEAGNHCRGCIFRDGSHLATEELRTTIDLISRKIDGYFIGRFDIRYVSDAELRAGRGFHILELNGSASEATHIYDERNSLGTAYCILYQQWKLVYAIGAENRRRGFRSASILEVWRDWRAYVQMSADYPAAS